MSAVSAVSAFSDIVEATVEVDHHRVGVAHYADFVTHAPQRVKGIAEELFIMRLPDTAIGEGGVPGVLYAGDAGISVGHDIAKTGDGPGT